MKLKQSGPLAPANEPWTLIRDAIKDLELQEKQEGVKIEMDSWHSPCGSVCEQCLGGSVMSRRLGTDTDDKKFPLDFPKDVSDRLCALEELRCGEIVFAYRELKLERPSSIPECVFIPAYRNGPAAFKAAMRELADRLEAAQPEPTNQ